MFPKLISLNFQVSYLIFYLLYSFLLLHFVFFFYFHFFFQYFYFNHIFLHFLQFYLFFPSTLFSIFFSLSLPMTVHTHLESVRVNDTLGCLIHSLFSYLYFCFFHVWHGSTSHPLITPHILSVLSLPPVHFLIAIHCTLRYFSALYGIMRADDSRYNQFEQEQMAPGQRRSHRQQVSQQASKEAEDEMMIFVSKSKRRREEG